MEPLNRDQAGDVTPLPPSRPAKKFHRKSRLGCYTCKRRRVKCDEIRPTCSACTNFSIPCQYGELATSAPSESGTIVRHVHNAATRLETLSRRGPGRPRRNWAATLIPEPKDPHNVTNDLATRVLFSTGPLDLSQAELLHHFSMFTGPSLVCTRDPTHPTVLFWQRNAPRVGLAQSYVLHFILALAAFHLRYLVGPDEEKGQHYLNLARHHLSAGINGMNKALTRMDNESCGALLLSSMLICWCTFATGQTGPEDLLMADLGSTAPGRMIALSKGNRMIAEKFPASILLSGLLEPLQPQIAGARDDQVPLHISLGIPRIDWVGPLGALRTFILGHSSQKTTAYLQVLETLTKTYEAVYGNDDGTMTCPTFYKVVLVFLYLADDDYITDLKNGDPLALLILAHYVPLLEIDPNAWYLRGWARPIVRKIWESVDEEYLDSLKWPLEITR